MSDRELILSYKNGDVSAFEEFYRLTKDSLYTFLYNRGGSEVEDIFQESFSHLTVVLLHHFAGSAPVKTETFR